LHPEWQLKYHEQQPTSVKKVIPEKTNSKGPITHHETYPICFTYFKPRNLIVFALVSEIAIYTVVGGNIKSFTHVASHKIDINNEFVPMCIDVGIHKVSGNLLVCLAA
jgi:hypothetical protein